jgi:hydroxypyruvate isomerase
MNRRKFGQLFAATALEAAVLRSRAQTAPPAASATAPRFSVMLWALGRTTPFDKGLEMVAEAGYQGVELTGQFAKWTPEEQRGIMARMSSLKLVFDSMSGVRAGFAVPEGGEEFLTQATAHIKKAKEIGCPQVILLSGKRSDGVDPQAQKQTSIDNLKRASDVAAENGVDIVIEPIDPLENPPIFLQSVTVGFEIVRAVNRPNVKVLYDYYHEQRSFGNLIEKFEKNAEWVGLVHIADVPGRHDPGTGEVDYGSIYRAMGKLKYNRFIAMEYYPVGDIVTSLKKARTDAQQALSSAS